MFLGYRVEGYAGKVTTNSQRLSYSGCEYGTHAEMSVLSKYDKLKSNSKRVPSDLIVIRINRQGNMTNSKPCAKCIKYMSNSQYKIRHIYYSVDENTILRTSLKSLSEGPQHSSWRFSRKYIRKN